VTIIPISSFFSEGIVRALQRCPRSLWLCLALLSGLQARPAHAQAAPDTAAVASATEAAASWLDLIDNGKFDASWDAAAPALQGAITKAAWSQALLQARGPLEPFGARTLTSAQYVATLPNAPPGPYVVIQYRTKVANGREVIETVTPMRIPDGSWRVSGYYVRPAS
jgi:hypothetical protein